MGCGDNPKKVVIPIDFESEKMEEFGERIKSLNEKDKELLNSYMIRSEKSKKSSNSSIPTGTTVGEAIKNERQWQAERENKIADFKNAVDINITNVDHRDGSLVATIRIENKSDKNIVGVKGSFEIYNNFGEQTNKLSYAIQDINIGVEEYSNVELWREIYDDLNMSFFYNFPENFNPESFPEVIAFSDGTKIEIKN